MPPAKPSLLLGLGVVLSCDNDRNTARYHPTEESSGDSIQWSKTSCRASQSGIHTIHLRPRKHRPGKESAPIRSATPRPSRSRWAGPWVTTRRLDRRLVGGRSRARTSGALRRSNVFRPGGPFQSPGRREFREPIDERLRLSQQSREIELTQVRQFKNVTDQPPVLMHHYERPY